MTLSEKLRKSRSSHTLKSYADAVKQGRIFRAVQPITGKNCVSFVSMPKNEASTFYVDRKK
jgi:hypothetical protein